MGGPARDLIFISYSHQDETWMGRFARHFKILDLYGTAEIWSDQRIGAGAAWETEILQAIELARVAILLISPDSLGSDFIRTVEIPRILERHKASELAIVPVLVEPCLWQAVPWLRELQMRPWNAAPLSNPDRYWRETELVAITREVWELLADSRSPSHPKKEPLADPSAPPVPPAHGPAPLAPAHPPSP